MATVFSILLYLGCCLITFKLKRRGYFPLRVLLCTAVYFTVALVLSNYYRYLYVGWFSFYFFILIAVCVSAIMFCFKSNIFNAVFYVAISYTMEHVAHQLGMITRLYVDFPNIYWFYVTLAAFGVAVDALMYFAFIRRVEIGKDDNVFLFPDISTIVISVIAFLFIYVLSCYTDSLRNGYQINVKLYALGGSILLLFVQFGVFSRNKIEEEKKIISSILAAEHKQHALSKENIEMINMKCHDLKHQIAYLRQLNDEEKLEERLKEMEDMVMIYDSAIRTGNGALDVVLTEKKLYCNKYNIKLFTFIDGESVNFMKDYDIYSLFGNILDNAIEYLTTVENNSLKVINLRISCKNKLLVIHSENYCGEPLVFKGGLPVTIKADAYNHGYGMPSIKYIAKKYKGTLAVKQEDDRFILNIVIPLN